MDVFINDRQVGSFTTAGATVGEILEAARVYLDPQAVVTTVALDDVVFSAGEDERWARRAAADVRRLALQALAPRDFARVKRRELGETLVVLAGRVGLIGDLLRRHDDRTANRLLAAAMDELHLALLLEERLATLTDTPPCRLVSDVAAVAPALLAAEEQRAWGELADLLEAQLVPVLQAGSAALAEAAA